MILEVAILDVIPGKENEFESAFEQALLVIANMNGYSSHQLQRCNEVLRRLHGAVDTEGKWMIFSKGELS